MNKDEAITLFICAMLFIELIVAVLLYQEDRKLNEKYKTCADMIADVCNPKFITPIFNSSNG